MKYAVLFAWFWAVALSLHVVASSLEDYRPPEKGSVRIVRDSFGVPHIIARDERSLFYGAGYAQAQDQLENLVKNYLRAQGRIAEREGRAKLQMDQLVRMLGVPGRAKAHFEKLDAKSREHLEGFAAGVNAFIAENRDEIPEWIEPVKPEYILAFADYIDTLFTVSHCRRDLQEAGIRLSWLGDIPAADSLQVGSNQFAVAPGRSANGAAMLSMDPHLPHNDFFRWYEMHLVGPEINVMGACFFGTPYVVMGRTERSAWCMTVNGPDLGDVFAFQVDPDDPSRFKDIDGYKRFEISEETYRFLDGDKLAETKQPIYRTPVGPVAVLKDGVAYAFALPLSDNPARAAQTYHMARAGNVEEFKQALEPLGLVMFNIVYADTAGDIFYISNGRVPKRDERISSHAIRPGEEAWARWQGIHSLDELPQVLNPPSGFLMNSNSGPQNVCPEGAPQPEDFPTYMMSQKDNSRSRRLRALLSADDSITWEEMRDYATDTHVEAADELVPRWVAAIEQSGEEFQGDVAALEEVGKVLACWDRRTDLESRGAVLFAYIIMDREFHLAVRQNDLEAAARRVVEKAKEVKDRFGALDVPWKEFSRIRRGDLEI